MKLDFSSRSNHSRLFLLEIILAILAFSLVSAVCLQLFVKAHTLGQDTKDLDMAVRQSTSIAAILTQAETPMEQLKTLYPDASFDENKRSLVIHYDQEYQPCKEQDSIYQMQITSSPMDGQTTAYSIMVRKANSSSKIYTLEVTAYRQYIP